MLVAVIWTLGLITLLGMAVIVGVRYRTKTSSNYASVTAAEMAAESAVNLATCAAANKQRTNASGRQRIVMARVRSRRDAGHRVAPADIVKSQ